MCSELQKVKEEFMMLLDGKNDMLDDVLVGERSIMVIVERFGAVLLSLFCCILMVSGCSDKDGKHRDSTGQVTGRLDSQDEAPVSDSDKAEKDKEEDVRTEGKLESKPLPGGIKPAIKSYTIKSDLSNVENLSVFKEDLTAGMKEKLVKNGFVAVPTDYVQMFFIYENNEYKRPRYPAFITTDIMLHTYHMFFSYALRTIEARHLYEAASHLAELMAKESAKQLTKTTEVVVKNSARKNLAYFEVARALLAKESVSPDSRVKKIVKRELKLINAANGRAPSPLMENKLDYTMFKPRGHYTRTESLKRYFKAMVWFGLVPFELPKKGEMGEATLQAVLMTRALETARKGDVKALGFWKKIYEPTKFFVGEADDYTVTDYSKIVKDVYGENPSIDSFASKNKMLSFVKAVRKLPGPRIMQFFLDGATPTGRQFRFMGQRFIPDSRILQELSHPKVTKRFFPSGLDVFAAMGSERAFENLKTHQKALSYNGYEKQLRKMRKEMGAVTKETWESNLYWGWLGMLKALIEKAPEGFPAFMRNEACEDKSLFASLGSWTQLRHDTVLYAKPSAAECGGDEEEEKVKPKGYIEPNLVFWTRMKALIDKTAKGFKKHGILDEILKSRLKWVSEWVEFCRLITIKQLTEQRITEHEYAKMRHFGAEMEVMFQQLSGGQIMTEADKDMAVVVDIHTSSGFVLEEGVGRAAAIYVIVPTGGKLRLTRGGIFTHYEFKQPASNRLTDEQWQKRLKAGKVPELAPWIKSFFIQKKTPKGDGVNRFMGGC